MLADALPWPQLLLWLAAAYGLLQLLYAAARLAAALLPSRARTSLKAVARHAAARSWGEVLASLAHDADHRILAGLALACAGGRFFLRAPPGTGPATLLPLAALSLGCLTVLAALHELKHQPGLFRFRSLLAPGGCWSLSGDRELSGRFAGRPVRIRLHPPVYGHGAQKKELCPGHSDLRVALAAPAAAQLVLHHNAHWWEKDLRGLLKALPEVEAVGVGELRLHGAPADEAEALVRYWLANGLNTWRLEVKRTLGLRLASIRLWDSWAEFSFEGRLSEPVFFEAPP